MAILDASWPQLGARGRLLGSPSSTWTPLGSSQRHLNSTCFPKWSPSVTWTALGLSTELQAPFEVLLEIFGVTVTLQRLLHCLAFLITTTS